MSVRKWAALLPVVALAGVVLATGGAAQRAPAFDDPGETRAAMQRALEERRAAEARSQRLEREAAEASDAADRSRREAAALAARIQQAEAGIAAAEARMALIDAARDRLRQELGREQRPVVELTAALQNFARRPAGLALLRPGSVEEVVYLRAALAHAVPEVDRRTGALRARLARSRELAREAGEAADVLRAEEQSLAQRRQALAMLETRQRLAAREAGGIALREAERALALGEQARDLDALIGVLDRAGAQREMLAALPGPVLRPERPETAAQGAGAWEGDGAMPAAMLSPAPRARPPAPYQLPVTGRVVTGFGAPLAAGLSAGVTLAPRARAQVVAPAAGRVAFAGPYRGYGSIVIIGHAGGWTSLVTGLDSVDARVGDELVGGAPLGRAGPGRPAITLELRQGTEPVNPLPFVG